jgi:MoaA/NifB/PqqE/SkfB family radical SAM enzyme
MLTNQTLMVANECNLKCTYCWYETGADTYQNQSVTVAEYDTWLAACARRGPLHQVNLTGGEPLLRADLLDVFAVACRHARHTAVFTNGLLLTVDLAETLLAAGCEIHVSLDHASMGLGDRVRGGTAKTLAALELLGSVRAGPRVQVCMVLTSRNWNDLDAVAELAARFGFRLELIPVGVPDIHPLSLATLPPQARTELAAKLRGWRERLGRPLYYSRIAQWLTRGKLPAVSGCSFAECGVFINSAGGVQLCAARKPLLGNIKTDSPERILQQKEEEARRRRPGSCVSLGCLVVT